MGGLAGYRGGLRWDVRLWAGAVPDLDRARGDVGAFSEAIGCALTAWHKHQVSAAR